MEFLTWDFMRAIFLLSYEIYVYIAIQEYIIWQDILLKHFIKTYVFWFHQGKWRIWKTLLTQDNCRHVYMPKMLPNVEV
jgi:hypothetical protein